MRYSEIASLPSTPAEGKNMIMDLVTVYQGRDAASIPMTEILKVLHNQGFDANVKWVMDTLKNQSGVKRITPDEVILIQDIPTGVASPSEQEKSQEKVSKMATSAARKSMKNG